MFKLSQSDSYSWPVKVSLPTDGGRFIEQTFDAVFKRLSQSKIKEMLAVEGGTDSEFCKDILIGWKGITDDNGAEIPFSEDARDKLLDVPSVANATVEAYVTSASGKGAKRKN
jgi:hypothetical protein